MVENAAIEQFMDAARKSAKQGTLIKITLSKSSKAEALDNVYIRPIELKGVLLFSHTLRYPTRDEVKNHSIETTWGMLTLWLGSQFLNASLFTLEADFHLLFNKKRKARFYQKPPSQSAPPSTQHNREKQRFIAAKDNVYLRDLGITNTKGEVLKTGQRKFRQINKYIEIVDSLLKDRPAEQPIHIVDVGSGKGYLTFALYDYLQQRGYSVSITGIELRQPLVNFCNALAEECGFTQLQFVAQDINDYETGKLDMLIALHACDIATDIAIATGIRSEAELIVVAPCCHKQIRKQMNCETELGAILRHGILEERQAELVTDGIRALLMEDRGYKTKVFEFISTEHTSKNLMIVGTKRKVNPEAKQKVAAIKKQFGIEWHYLERLLEGRE